MPSDFIEKFDKEYLEFLVWIWHFPRDNEPKMVQIIDKNQVWHKVKILKNRHEIEKVLKDIEKEN